MTSATDNRTTELLPCPFCGGEARIFELRFGTGWRVLCSKSFCAQGPDGTTEAEAIAAWNQRHVETCENMSVDETQQFYCSECECTVDIPLLWGVVNFCPDCGCKVVDNADK